MAKPHSGAKRRGLTGLRRIRREMHLTQQQAADAVGVTRESISNYETGKYAPSVSTLAHLARYFDTSIRYLITGEDEYR